ncbi:YIF1 [Musa troglodytarum]|uniref:YIF1 n=1 Tax=Musa troglodytarum TaxID=320322 RepID=A0A9E7G0W6_9LILI|nr:YIF1 [Musa troglodytarum]
MSLFLLLVRCCPQPSLHDRPSSLSLFLLLLCASSHLPPLPLFYSLFLLFRGGPNCFLDNPWPLPLLLLSLCASPLDMYDNLGNQAGMQGPTTNPPPNPFGNAFYGAGSGLIRGGLGAYGEKFLGSSSEFMQSNISRYFSNPQYYFQVNDQYVRNKLKVILFPFLHRGHWTRITEPVGGRLSYKPPVYDINAPDLYIPFMAFGTYIVIAGFSFTPEILSLQLTRGLAGWFMQVLLLKGLLYSLGSGEAPLLDMVSYVKTMKRVLFTEMRSYEKHSSRQHYLLLFMAIAQFPLFFWLGKVAAG